MQQRPPRRPRLRPRRLLPALTLALLAGALGPAPARAQTGEAGDGAPAAPAAPVVEPVAPGEESATERRGRAYAHMMRAVFASRRGEFRQASAEIRKAIDLQPSSIEAHIQGAEMLLWMGRRAEAEQLGRRALELDGESADALAFLADLAASEALSADRDARARRDALELYERLRARRALDEQELRKLASLRMLDGDMDGSIAAARDLVAERPGDAQAARLLFRLLMHQGRADEAHAILLDYLARHPNDASFLDEARKLTTDLVAWDRVIAALEAHPDLEGRATATHSLLGEALLRDGQLVAATAALEAALKHNSADPAVRYNLTLAYHGQGRLADAAATARALAGEYPGHAAIQRLLGETLESQRDAEGALNAYAAALRILQTELDESDRPTRDGIRIKMARLHLAQDRPQAALRAIEELEREDSVEGLQLEARAALAAGDLVGARHAARRLRALGQAGAAALIEGRALLDQDRLSRARPKLDEALAESGPAARVPVADALRRAGRSAEGERLLLEWAEQAPGDADVAFQVGVYYYEDGRFEESERWMQTAIELDPEHAPALNYLGYGLAERGERLGEALDLVRRALEQDATNGAYLDSLGWIFVRMGDLEAARGPLERAAREFPKDATILDHLGELYARLGDRELALATWQRAAESERDPQTARAIRDKISALHADLQPDTSPDAQARGREIPDETPEK